MKKAIISGVIGLSSLLGCGDVGILQRCIPENYKHRSDYVSEDKLKENTFKFGITRDSILEKIKTIYQNGKSTNWEIEIQREYSTSTSLLPSPELYPNSIAPVITDTEIAQCQSRSDEAICQMGTYVTKENKDGKKYIQAGNFQTVGLTKESLNGTYGWVNTPDIHSKIRLPDSMNSTCTAYIQSDKEDNYRISCDMDTCFDEWDKTQKALDELLIK
ncbi:hypothetical protein HQ489_05630 [Candidatus Woesearchaeota archaeon]|nr:hypothetical protein [Candidatus Woesearchaeota archaeon]